MPNAGRQAPLEAAATQERRLEAVACTPVLDPDAPQGHGRDPPPDPPPALPRRPLARVAPTLSAHADCPPTCWLRPPTGCATHPPHQAPVRLPPQRGGASTHGHEDPPVGCLRVGDLSGLGPPVPAPAPPHHLLGESVHQRMVPSPAALRGAEAGPRTRRPCDGIRAQERHGDRRDLRPAGSNATLQAPLEAGATQERRLEAVAWLG